MTTLPLSDGSLFAGRYRVLRMIASGGMGAVYEGVHEVTGRRCAIKAMLGHTLKREAMRARFLQEARVAARIRSPYVVDVLDAGVDDYTNAPFLVMELLDGEDVADRLGRVGRFDAAEAVLLLWQTALAIDKLHRSGIVHRDLKPRNLFIVRGHDGKPCVKLLDFGVAKMLEKEGAAESGTQNVGTPLYMAPEQFSASGRVSGATDIYALGLLAYTLLVGDHYWHDEHSRADNAFAFAALVGSGPEERASLRADRALVKLSLDFDLWFSKATARVPAARFSSAVEAVAKLAVALGVHVPAPPQDEDTGEPFSSERPSAFPMEALAATAGATATGSAAIDATRTSLTVTSVDPPRKRKPLIAAAIGAPVLVGILAAALWARDSGGSDEARRASEGVESATASSSTPNLEPSDPRKSEPEASSAARPSATRADSVAGSKASEASGSERKPAVLPNVDSPAPPSPARGSSPSSKRPPRKAPDRRHLYARD